MSDDRPMVNVYEGDPEALVCRPMNDAEFAQWQADQAAALPGLAAAAQPTIEEKLIGHLETLPAGASVTASDLLAILRPGTMNTDAPAHTDHPAAGA